MNSVTSGISRYDNLEARPAQFPSALPASEIEERILSAPAKWSNSNTGGSNKKRKFTRTSPSVPQKRVHNLTMKKIYIEQIRSGIKTVEGRIFTKSVTKFQVGDRVRFWYYSNSRDDVICKITKIERHVDFNDMLMKTGFKNCITDAADHSEALNTYHSIPSYFEKSQKFGVLAIHLNLSTD